MTARPLPPGTVRPPRKATEMNETKTDPLRLLAEVEQALEGATPGPWREGAMPYVYAELLDGFPVVADCYARENVAAIVAAVNAAPKLVAALRREWERHQHDGTGFCAYDGLVWPCVAHRDLTTALGGETGA